MAQLIYGRNVIRQALSDSSRVHAVYLTGRDEAVEKQCRSAGIPVKTVDRRTLTRMAGTDRHQGIAAEVDSYRLYTVDELIAEHKHPYGFLILLDGLEDPHNLGAVLRTADAVGADGVIFGRNRSVSLTPTVAKVSTGAIDTVKCAAVTNLVRTVQDLKKKGYWIVGTDMNGQDYRSLEYDFNTVLVIGNEGKGISRLLREECDYIVSIPMIGTVESLNASVSTAILSYEIYRHRFPL